MENQTSPGYLEDLQNVGADTDIIRIKCKKTKSKKIKKKKKKKKKAILHRRD
jgi:hypothetical protein